jgi:Response regulator of the LytR/AlgR family
MHPFVGHIRLQIAGVFFSAIFAALMYLFLLGTGYDSGLTTLADSIVHTVVMAASGFLLWYIIRTLNAIPGHVVLTILVQLLCLGVSYVVELTYAPQSVHLFIGSIPFRLTLGVLSWVILILWYQIYILRNQDEDSDMLEFAEPQEKQTVLERISVKDGSRIHILQTDELIYVQACGDYATFFTATGQYMKEQTMKSLEVQLPLQFIRIHRSLIVNSNYISRIELYEKDSYNIRLKNGVSLKASLSGYKRLKDYLSL